jgi:hypothetical protein
MAEHGIIGDSFGTELPETVVAAEDLSAERNAAKFSRTKEFGVLKDHLESRIVFYQTYLPDGRSISEHLPTGEEWAVANAVIGELKAVIAAYETASEVVANADRRIHS